MSSIIERLRIIGNLKTGDKFPPEFGDNWGAKLSALCMDAADEIEELRADVERYSKLIEQSA